MLTKPWYRANEKTVEGFGLGLNHVQQIAKNLKGTLKLENTISPRGFKATLNLPLNKT
jgi:signal transduction histidine kinase